MALYCIWFKRGCARFAALDQPLPAGSALEAHVDHCAACREYWLGLRDLTSQLDSLLTVPRRSGTLTEPNWHRVPRAPAGLNWVRMSLAAVAACGLASGWITWRLAFHGQSGAPSEVVTRYPIKPMDEGPASTGPALTKITPSSEHSDSELPPLRRLRHRDLISYRPAMRVPRLRDMVRSRAPREEISPEVARAAAAGQWQASGVLFENAGDPGLANVAYQAAYQERPTEETAFDMGRSAEESGDIDQAMSAYASLLEAADVKSRQEKSPKP